MIILYEKFNQIKVSFCLKVALDIWRLGHSFLTFSNIYFLFYLLPKSRIPECFFLGNLIRPQVWSLMVDQKMYDMLERSRQQIDCCCSKSWQMWEREQVLPCAARSKSVIKVSFSSLTSSEGL